MKRRYLVPGIVGLIIGLFLGYSLSYFAPDLGARLASGARRASFVNKKAPASNSSSSGSNTRCPIQDPNEFRLLTLEQKKSQYAWCQPNQSGTGTYYTCNISKCIGDGKRDFGFTGELYNILGVTGRGYADDPNSDLYFRSCSQQACRDAEKFNLPVVIYGYVYEDLNTTTCCDGIKDSGEKGIPNRTVELTADWGTGGSTSVSTTTKDDGFFIFPYNIYRLTGGMYRLTHKAPDGFTRTTDDSLLDYWGPGGKNTHDFGVFKQP